MLIKGYSDFSLETVGCSPDVAIPLWRAVCKFGADVSHLFPYINAVVKDARYYEKPHYIQFTLDGCRCALYPDNVAALAFEDRGQAVKFFENLIDFLNELDAKRDSMEPDDRKYSPVPVFEILKLLPKTNCKKCGYPACMAFAAALRQGEVTVEQCPELQDDEDAVKLKNLIGG